MQSSSYRIAERRRSQQILVHLKCQIATFLPTKTLDWQSENESYSQAAKSCSCWNSLGLNFSQVKWLATVPGGRDAMVLTSEAAEEASLSLMASKWTIWAVLPIVIFSPILRMEKWIGPIHCVTASEWESSLPSTDLKDYWRLESSAAAAALASLCRSSATPLLASSMCLCSSGLTTSLSLNIVVVVDEVVGSSGGAKALKRKSSASSMTTTSAGLRNGLTNLFNKHDGDDGSFHPLLGILLHTWPS